MEGLLAILSITAICYNGVLPFIYCNAECHYAECHYAERHYAECHYAKCHYAECHYAECYYTEGHYADMLNFIMQIVLGYFNQPKV